jgi:hypothetical protein
MVISDFNKLYEEWVSTPSTNFKTKVEQCGKHYSILSINKSNGRILVEKQYGDTDSIHYSKLKRV